MNAIPPRHAGVLLHPSSLPSGRVGEDALRWIDWLADSGFSVWQMLPLGVPLAGVSPYQCASAFALNPQLFPEDLPPVRKTNRAFRQWYATHAGWVDDYALFMVIKQRHECLPWFEWPEPLRRHDAAALADFRQQNEKAIDKQIRQQYQLYLHWQTLRSYARERGLILFGDMPLFVAHDSADVWSHPECFLLDEKGQPTLVAGVPPDYFSVTGQRWGNPQYDWNQLQQEGFSWWQDRLRYNFECFDWMRLDHFRGLAASWMIPVDSTTAVDGYWQTVPGEALLAAIEAQLGHVKLVAEDLGVITPDVNALRNKFDLPGMSVLQFAFDAYADNPHKPQNVMEDRVFYTGTHDNNTSMGWFDSLDMATQAVVLAVLGVRNRVDVVPAMIATVLSSRARLAMIPMQDLLQLGSEARMNTPGTVDGNWRWRFDWAQVPDTLSVEMRKKLNETGRIGHA